MIRTVPALHVCLCGNHGLSGFSQVLKSQEHSINLKCLVRSRHLKPPKECAANRMLSACRFSRPAKQICFTCAHTHKSQGVIKEVGGGIILYQIIHSFSKGDKFAHSISRSGLFCSIQRWAYWQESKTRLITVVQHLRNDTCPAVPRQWIATNSHGGEITKSPAIDGSAELAVPRRVRSKDLLHSSSGGISRESLSFSPLEEDVVKSWSPWSRGGGGRCQDSVQGVGTDPVLPAASL